MRKKSDLEIIKQIEKELRITLKKIKIDDIDKKEKWGVGYRIIEGLRAYALDEEDRVIGLSLDYLRLSNPQWRLVSQLHFLNHASFKGTFLEDSSIFSSMANLTSLNLGDNNLNDISFLSSLTNLVSLDLSWNKSIKDYSFIISLINLTSINLSDNNLSDISFISSLANLTCIDLSWNKSIKDFSVISLLTTLASLNLSYNSLSDISNLSLLKNLTSLDLSWNKSIKDYSILPSLSNLTSLELAGNNLTDVSSLSSLTKITTLNLSYNNLTNISDLSLLKNLVSLDLSWNKTINDYTVLSSLSNLTSLNLSYNNFSNISILSLLANLTSLDLTGNNLTDISILSSLTNLTSLNLSYNDLNESSILSSLTNLTSLNLMSNHFSDISFLSQLINLTSLDLAGNNLIDVSILSSLTSLASLNLAGNNINDITILSSMINLMSLDLAGNNINDISFLSSLTNLTFLNLSYNGLNNVSILSSLTRLTILYLRSNKISDSSFLKHLYHLQYVDIEENSLINPPPEIVKKGIGAMRSYFKQMDEQGSGRLYEARLLLVGEPNAGKTSLLKKVLDPDYIVPNDEEETTLGIEINSQLKFDYHHDKSITFKVNIWDFGGQPIQYMLHQYFLTSRSLYVLVSDDREQRTRFDYWFDIIKVLGEKSPVLVVLNEKKHRYISNFDYDNYKKRYAPYYDMEKRDVDFSIKDGRLEVLKNKIEEMLSGLKHIGDELPRQWVTIRKELESIKEKNQIGINYYFDICRKHGLQQEQDMLTLCGYLNALGVVMHYKDDRTLENTIFVNPHWIVDALYAAISDKTIEVKKGRINKNWLFKLWEQKGYTYDERCKLLNLMLKDNFEICYRVAEGKGKKEEYMVPMLLPDVEPDYVPFLETVTLKFRFQYSFMPEGLISRLIVRLHEDIEKQSGQDLIWKKGFILNRNGTRARVAEDRSEKGLKIIDIKISGEEGSRRDFLAVIRNEVRNIHIKSFKDIDVEEMVPCNCSRCRTVEKSHYFEYSELQRYLRAGENIIKCSQSIEPVDIWKLIEEVVPREEVREDYHTYRKELGGDIDIERPIPSPNVSSRLKSHIGTEGSIQQIKVLEDRITVIREQLETEENKKKECDKMAECRANHSSWWIVEFNVLLLTVWAVLIFVFSWDTMEKWTFLAGVVLAVVNALYFAIFRRKLNSEEIKAIRLENKKGRLYHLYGVNMKTINRLRSELQEAESQKKKLLSANNILII